MQHPVGATSVHSRRLKTEGTKAIKQDYKKINEIKYKLQDHSLHLLPLKT